MRKQALKILRPILVGLCLVVAVPVILVPAYWVLPPVSTTMLLRYVTLQPVTREWWDIDDVSDRLKASVVMSEDGQFCRHWGVDLGAFRAELRNWAAGRRARGASTISMQVARNLFLWNGRSTVRKALELPLAVYIDLVLSKRRIMEIYLNIAEWGPNGEFGIQAGAQAAFGRDADVFSWQQAALMAVTLPNPHLRKPARPSRGMLAIARIVSRRAQGAAPYIGCLYPGGQVALQ
jgi:monofunctional biosynthetic peptidoglycan transglycosylase